jgi:hypothetical protein
MENSADILFIAAIAFMGVPMVGAIIYGLIAYNQKEKE